MVYRSEHSTHTTELQLELYNRLDYDFRFRLGEVTRLTAVLLTCSRDVTRKRNAQTRPTPDRLVTSLPSDGTCAHLDFPERVSRELTQNSSCAQTPGYEQSRTYNDTSTALYVSFT